MPFIPAYLKLPPEELRQRVRAAGELLKRCSLCPRNCGVDRSAGETGFCKTTDKLRVASWGPHFGEEAPLVGRYGSGTIFFSSCNLGCVFCQNWDISRLREGEGMPVERLEGIMKGLQEAGCHNINLVTPTHQMPMILHSLVLAAEAGLNIPLVYNCGGYEAPEALELLEGIVDIYMPDLKYSDPSIALNCSQAEGYPEHAKAAIREMHRQVGNLTLDERGIALRGLLVRHLVLPGGLAGTAEAARFIAEEISPDTLLNIMDQYHPCDRAFEYPPLDRRLSREEYEKARREAIKAGLKSFL